VKTSAFEKVSGTIVTDLHYFFFLRQNKNPKKPQKLMQHRAILREHKFSEEPIVDHTTGNGWSHTLSGI